MICCCLKNISITVFHYTILKWALNFSTPLPLEFFFTIQTLKLYLCRVGR